MNRIQFSINIEAAKHKIWESLWGDVSYRAWASVFFEGSYVVTADWNEGSQVMFLAPDQSGIYSVIETHIPEQLMKFKHIGNVVKGVAQEVDEESKAWSGATEFYTLSGETTIKKLTIELDVLDEHLEFMTTKLPEALEKIKLLSEKH